jgi:hypothetical protein
MASPSGGNPSISGFSSNSNPLIGTPITMTKRLERFSLGGILFLVGANLVFALEVADYAWAITRIAPTQDTYNCNLL